MNLHVCVLGADEDLFLPDSQKRVCLVTYEVAGPHLNGGIGTAFTNLALALAKQGHKVSSLLTASGDERQNRFRRDESTQPHASVYQAVPFVYAW